LQFRHSQRDQTGMKKRRKTCRLEEISDEILVLIFGLLSPQDLVVCSRVCRRWQATASDGQLWRAHVHDSFPWRKQESAEEDWKSVYRKMWNWTTGRHALVDARQHEGMVMYCEGHVVTAGRTLRVWKGEQLLDEAEIQQATRMAVDVREGVCVMLAHQDGWSVYRVEDTLRLVYAHGISCDYMALCWPYAVTLSITSRQQLRLWRLPGKQQVSLLSSVVSSPPLALSLQAEEKGVVVVSIAHCLPRYRAGYTPFVQRLSFQATGGLVASQYISCKESIGKPLSMAFAPPDLLTSHGDNTLAWWRVSASSMHGPQRLWGHTSGIAAAGISSQRAVSMAAHELRIWHLDADGGRDRGVPITLPSGTHLLHGLDGERVLLAGPKDDGRGVFLDFS